MHWVAILIMLIGAQLLRLFYGMQARGDIFSDFLAHIDLHRFYLEHGQIIFPPLYYLSLEGLSRLLTHSNSYPYAAGIILIAFTLFKYGLSYKFIRHGQNIHPYLAALLALLLMLFFPYYLFSLEGKYLYMGKFTPQLWHNCTLTFVWPFCFLLFWVSLKWLTSESTKSLSLMLLFAVLVALAKPSFLFAFIPVLPVMTWVKARNKTLISLFFSSLMLLLVWGLKVLIYSNPLDAIANSEQQGNEVVISPLATYWLYAESPILEFLASFAFPIAAFALYGKILIQHTSVQFSLVLSIAALLVYFMFAEKGFRFEHANFYWQIPICLSLLYLCIVKELCLIFQAQKNLILNWKFQSLCILFLAHVGSGVYYLNHYLNTKSYL
ncbi:hypothetical protein [Algoriphagus halophytocola]|uniref:Glycosyltransferase RgtA/B/C/D-like domain-containing protein n=1 Tax=Algoriphagus halophytocola TaxID=2991499 RepID=A0ABY6MKA3_9BACT|nr:hypothetical protein [Algoriphagus sp. TR-M5]UZD23944.1 hypothetical protein OM944_05485 [Algoriphagus sp. TR-M5]